MGSLLRTTAVVLAALTFTACELGTESPTSDNVSVSSRAENNACPAALRTGSAQGQACTVSGDCAEVCCSCSSRAKTFGAAACVNSTCAGAAVTCQKAEENRPSLCE